MSEMADACREQILQLLQDSLFESAEVLCSFVISSFSASPSGEEVWGNSCVVFLELLADSLFAQGEFKRASSYFQRALQECGPIRRHGMVSGTPPRRSSTALESKESARLSYKNALCLVELKDISSAVKLLEMIPDSLKNVKVCSSMGKLYLQLGLNKSAISSFKQVLMLLPSSVETIESLGN